MLANGSYSLTRAQRYAVAATLAMLGQAGAFFVGYLMGGVR